jgi:serine protease Do
LLVESASGPAATAGVQPGDIILRVGTAPVNSVDDLRRATQRSKGTVALLIQRGNAHIYVPVPLG